MEANQVALLHLKPTSTATVNDQSKHLVHIQAPAAFPIGISEEGWGRGVRFESQIFCTVFSSRNQSRLVGTGSWTSGVYLNPEEGVLVC